MASTQVDHNNGALRYCVIVPTYNNEKTLKSVLEDVLKVTSDVIVVNDGSTDSTSKLLSNFETIQVIEYRENGGKGNALKLGFRKAIDEGFDYAITIDSDGQHHPDDILKLVEKFTSEPGKLVMGSRNMEQESVPGKSSFGNKFSNFWFWVDTGIKLSDTQTGFRAYPLSKIKNMRFFTRKFEFEIEVIVRLAWKNVKYAEVPVKVDYPEDRISHFRPFKDFTRISVLNTVLFVLALSFFLPRLLLINFSFKQLWNNLKNEFTKDLNHPVKLAAAVGLGLFFGILPIWGFQMIVAFAVASYFKLNRALVLIISNISVPPIIPLIIYASFEFGGLFVENRVYLLDFDSINRSTIYLHLVQYVTGAIALSVVLGIVGAIVTWVLAISIKKVARS